MQIKNKLKNPLIFGTLLLTATGVLSKIIGFSYRIFLSRTIGAEGLGIYQLIFPVFTICFSVTAAGISTAISKYTAQFQYKDPFAPKKFLFSGCMISLVLSLLSMLLLQSFSGFIAQNILLEPRCAKLLPILSYSIPLASLHDCINSYYYGKKKTAVPAASQLIEQTIRCASVYFLYLIQLEKGGDVDAAAAVWGMVIGDIAAFLFCITALSFDKALTQKANSSYRVSHPAFTLIRYSIPLSTNRLALTMFASFESILIPSRLKLFGYSHSDALSVYGILTGMSLSIVMFPTVFTNSISVMILPMISEAAGQGNQEKINRTIHRTIVICLLLGFLCTVLLLSTGQYIGDFLFGNTLSGKFIVMLSWICPFLFLTSILTSILHGLGMPGYPFVINLFGSFIRILFVFFLIPIYGLKAYLFGMLSSQIVTAGLSIWILSKKRIPT